MTPPRRPSRAPRGAGAIEFALTMPILLLMLLGIVELCLLGHRHHVVSQVVRDAGRIASGVLEGVEPTGDDIEAAAIDHCERAFAFQGINCELLNCRLDADWHEDRERMFLTVTVSIPYEPVTTLYDFMPSETVRTYTVMTQQQMPPEPEG